MTMSINDIRKLRFIENQSLDDFTKLLQLANRNPCFFDDLFLIDAFQNAINNKNITGITYIAQIYIALDRLLEAEYILNASYQLFPHEIILLYFLSDISSRRHIFFASNYFCEELKKKEGKLLYTKAQIKFYLLQGNTISLDYLILNSLDRYCYDLEYCLLSFEACRFTKNIDIACSLFLCKSKEQVYENLNDRGRQIAKQMVLSKLVKIIGKYKNGL